MDVGEGGGGGERCKRRLDWDCVLRVVVSEA